MTIRRVVVALLIAVVFGGVLSSVYIDISYDASMPRVPQPDTGRVYLLVVNHGAHVYVNREELNRANFVHDVFVLGLCCVLALVAIQQYWKE